MSECRPKVLTESFFYNYNPFYSVLKKTPEEEWDWHVWCYQYSHCLYPTAAIDSLVKVFHLKFGSFPGHSNLDCEVTTKYSLSILNQASGIDNLTAKNCFVVDLVNIKNLYLVWNSNTGKSCSRALREKRGPRNAHTSAECNGPLWEEIITHARKSWTEVI